MKKNIPQQNDEFLKVATLGDVKCSKIGTTAKAALQLGAMETERDLIQRILYKYWFEKICF